MVAETTGSEPKSQPVMMRNFEDTAATRVLHAETPYTGEGKRGVVPTKSSANCSSATKLQS